MHFPHLKVEISVMENIILIDLIIAIDCLLFLGKLTGQDEMIQARLAN